MSKQRRVSAVGAVSAIVLAALALGFAGCGKRSDGSSTSAESSAERGQPGMGVPGAAPSAADERATSEAQDSDESGEGPEIPGTIEGTPATMSPEAYLSAYRQIDGVVVLDNGLMYQVQSSGKGRSPKPEDSVRVSYKGTLMDGTTFDETKPGETATFELAKTIPGWREVLPLMKEGDNWQVVIPPALAYGDEGAPGIPPDSLLIFDIELVEVIRG